MAMQITEPISRQEFDNYIDQAAKAAGYEQGFGIRECDLSKPLWWTAYCRQSLDQQAGDTISQKHVDTISQPGRLLLVGDAELLEAGVNQFFQRKPESVRLQDLNDADALTPEGIGIRGPGGNQVDTETTANGVDFVGDAQNRADRRIG